MTVNQKKPHIDANFNNVVLTKVLPQINKAFCLMYDDFFESKLKLQATEKQVYEEFCKHKAEVLKSMLNEYIDKQVELFKFQTLN